VFKANYHTHVKYCNHAVGDVKDYIKAAINFGLEEIGMTDHAPILESFMSEKDYDRIYGFENMKMPTVDIYLNDIEEARKNYGDKIRILSGFESEYIDGHLDFYKDLRKRVDYLNLGVHYYVHDGILYDTYKEVDYKNLDYYVETVKNALDTNLFNVLVHPDLFMISYKDENGNRVFDENCLKATREILEYCIKKNVYVEINANGIKRADLHDRSTWLYPYVKFWEIAKEYKDLKVLIGADAHNPEHIYNERVKEAIKFADDLGIKVEKFMTINH